MSDRSSAGTRIAIVAGEPSGDLHAARLMAALRTRIPDVVFEGIGGPAMEAEGLRSMARLKDVAVSGFWEVARRYGFFRALLERCKTMLEQRRPSLFIPVDYPGFNFRLAAHAKRCRIPVGWYVAPQLWAWGKGRGPALAAAVDRLLAVFPFEPAFFDQFGIRTTYVGHPLLDDPAFRSMSTHEGRRLALFPGSRRQELQRHLPLMVATVRQLPTDVRPVVAMAPGVDERLLQPLIDAGAEPTTDSRGLMATAGAGLVKAGTSTLEAALSGLPFATFYRTSPLSYHLTKRLITVSSVTMINLLLDRPVVHEYLQAAATAPSLVREVRSLLDDAERRAALRAAGHDVRTMLGGPGAAERAADVLAEMVRR